MKTVYIVTSGCYSDYCINAVFDNKTSAEAYCALGHGDCVEEYEINSTLDTSDPVDYVYCFHISNPNKGYNGEPQYIMRNSIDGYKHRIKTMYNQRGTVITNTVHIDRFVFLDENNEELAKKIVQDRIAKAKAEQAQI